MFRSFITTGRMWGARRTALTALLVFVSAASPCHAQLAEAAKSLAATTQKSDANAEVGDPPAFAGTFHATVQGEQSVAKLRQKGTKISGVVDGIRIAGNAQGSKATVQLIDAQTGVVGGTAQLERRGDQLIATLTVTDPTTGQAFKVPSFIYTIEGARAQEPAAKPAEAAGDVQIDQRLVGSWVHTSIYRSGDFTGSSERRMVLKEDGTFEYSAGSATAGDSNNSVVARGGGDVTTGTWRAENKVLYTKPTGATEWSSNGRYSVDENNILIESGGGKTLWERR